MAEAEQQLRITVVQKGHRIALMRTICSTAVSLAMIRIRHMGGHSDLRMHGLTWLVAKS